VTFLVLIRQSAQLLLTPSTIGSTMVLSFRDFLIKSNAYFQRLSADEGNLAGANMTDEAGIGAVLSGSTQADGDSIQHERIVEDMLSTSPSGDPSSQPSLSAATSVRRRY
jgi:hypothetical protein